MFVVEFFTKIVIYFSLSRIEAEIRGIIENIQGVTKKKFTLIYVNVRKKFIKGIVGEVQGYVSEL